jgi:hypothetical protein
MPLTTTCKRQSLTPSVAGMELRFRRNHRLHWWCCLLDLLPRLGQAGGTDEFDEGVGIQRQEPRRCPQRGEDRRRHCRARGRAAQDDAPGTRVERGVPCCVYPLVLDLGFPVLASLVDEVGIGAGYDVGRIMVVQIYCLIPILERWKYSAERMGRGVHVTRD